MNSDASSASLVFHAGALGDFVLTWPLLRALAAAGRRPIVVAADSHARLARRCLSIRTLSSERREATELWRESIDADLRAAWATLLAPFTPARVISFVADERSSGGRCWLANARRVFPSSEVLAVAAPASPARADAWSRFDVARLGAAQPRASPGGTVVLHVGAGSREKCWPLDHWMTLGESLRHDGHRVWLIAGEVERERMSEHERAAFQHIGGRVLNDLDELIAVLGSARAFVGADTGPTHLAAQLGLPTLALFGPTDPRVWAPVGPCVCVLAPESPRPMTWLGPHHVRPGLDRLLAQSAHAATSK